ncbi:hypothetical protein [Rickettsia endosymbiont of Urophora cardui]|uniref:hypothetical protein n=1 Tax=Rickettsia endosymbiont of Urophora cardui TaxID=3066265 RepID=UPI00313D3A86
MQHTSDDEPIKYKVKVKVNDKLRISQRMKENVSEIILEPHARVIIEPEIELSNNTSDQIHIYTVDDSEYKLTGDIPYSA